MPGMSSIGPYRLRHSVRVSVSTVPSARRTSTDASVLVIGVDTPSTMYDVGEAGSSVSW